MREYGRSVGGSGYRSAHLQLPKPPQEDSLGAVNESLQGGWTGFDAGFRYRRLREAHETWENSPQGYITERDLSSDQRLVYDHLEEWLLNERKAQRDGEPATLITLGGYAGTGKSTLISVFLRACGGASVACCAYTGKAASVLRSKMRENQAYPGYVGTIHSLIYKTNPSLGELVFTKLDYIPYDLIIVDEASMIPPDVLRDLRSFNKPILAVGDHGQLPPVQTRISSPGAVVESPGSNLMENPDLRLEKIHRQAEGNPIIALSKFIREHGEIPMNCPWTDRVRFLHPDHLERELEKIHRENQDEFCATLLSYSNAKRTWANKLVRRLRLGEERSKHSMPAPTDTVICLRNKAGLLFNGMRGRVVQSTAVDHLWFWNHMLFEEEGLEIKAMTFSPQYYREKTISKYQDVTEYNLDPNHWASAMGFLFDYGYCLTVHKSQGSQFDHAFVLYERPKSVDSDSWKRWLYTSCTRARDRLTVVTR